MSKCTKGREREVFHKDLIPELNHYGLGIRLFETTDNGFTVRMTLHGKVCRHSPFLDFYFGPKLIISPTTIRNEIFLFERWLDGEELETVFNAHTRSRELTERILNFYHMKENDV